MRKILFIVSSLLDKKAAGVHRYTLEILKEIDKLAEKDEVELLIPASEPDKYGFENIKVIRAGIKIPISGMLGIRIERYFEKNIYAPLYAHHINAITIDLLLQFPLFGCDVIAIHDCRVNRYPEYYEYSNKQRRARRKLLAHQNAAVKHCKRIITVSDFSKAEILAHYDTDANNVDVVYNAWQHFLSVEENVAILKKLDVQDKQYFFSLGSRFPHKNRKWISYVARKHTDCKFIISGDDRGGTDFSFEGEHMPNVVFAGRLSDSEVKTLMRHCRAFIQPSLYEGFGIPPLEAMSVGADCIVSDIPVFREIYKNSVWYIDPLDYDNIDLDKTMSAIKDSNDIILNEFSWEKSALKLWDILKELAEK